MAGEEIKQSAGFLDPTSGKLRSNEELQKADASLNSSDKSASQNEPASISEFTQGVSNALGNLQAQMYEGANKLITAANDNLDQLKSAKGVDKEIKVKLKELKQLFKEGGDAEKISAKKEEIAASLREADGVAADIKLGSGDGEYGKISLGSEQKGSFTIKPVDVSKIDIDLASLNSAADVNGAIDTVSDEINSIKGQQSQLKETKREIQNVVEDTRKQLDTIESRVIQSESEATSLANSLAGQISAGSNQIAAHSISSTVVQSLLK